MAMLAPFFLHDSLCWCHFDQFSPVHERSNIFHMNFVARKTIQWSCSELVLIQIYIYICMYVYGYMVANNVNIPSGSDKEFANWNFTIFDR